MMIIQKLIFCVIYCAEMRLNISITFTKTEQFSSTLALNTNLNPSFLFSHCQQIP